jgi:predicted nuclease of restriction endonuclease-like (RecB) superfamily
LGNERRPQQLYKKIKVKIRVKTRLVAALVATMLLLSPAIPTLAQKDTDNETDTTPATIIRDPYLEEYLPCTNARYRAWYGAP